LAGWEQDGSNRIGRIELSLLFILLSHRSNAPGAIKTSDAIGIMDGICNTLTVLSDILMALATAAFGYFYGRVREVH